VLLSKIFLDKPKNALFPPPYPNIPLKMEEALLELETLANNVITESQLQTLTGFDDLTQAHRLTLSRVVTKRTPVYTLGDLLPNLTSLKFLNNCHIPSFRDLGTRLCNLQYLWLSNCHVSDLSGVNGLPRLEELYLSFNEIEYLDEISFHENLQVLDLEANKVGDIEQVEALSTCLNLNCLTLSGCPIEAKEGFNYRRKVAASILNLKFLDDEEINGDDQQDYSEEDEQQRNQHSSEFDFNLNTRLSNKNAWSSPNGADGESEFVTQAIKKLNKADIGSSSSSSSSSSSDEETTENLALTLKTPAAHKRRQRPHTARPRLSGDDHYQNKLLKLLNLSQFSPSSNSSNNIGRIDGDDGISSFGDGENAASSLTYGRTTAIAGEPSRGLRSHRLASKSIRNLGGISTDVVDNNIDSDEIEYEVAGDSDSFKSAIAELKSWRFAHGTNLPRSPGGSMLKIKDRPGNDRPGTAPSFINAFVGNYQPPSTPSTNSEICDTSFGSRVNSREMARSQLNSREIEEGVSGTGNSWDNVGGAGNYSDSELVAMLRLKPKEVPQMRTRNSFKKFFNGMPRKKLEMLLRRAYSDLGDQELSDSKVQKRIAMMAYD